MKIALVSHSISKFSGVGRVVNELVKYYKTEHEVHIIAPMGENCDNGCIYHPIPLLPYSWETKNLSFFLRSGMMLRKESFDIVHLHTPSWFKNGIVTCHGLPRIGMQLLKRLDKKYRREVSKKFIVRNMLSYPLYDYNYRCGRHRKIIALSKEICSYLQTFYKVSESAIELIPNGVDLAAFHPDHRGKFRDATRRQLGIFENDFVFLFIGNFFKRKGLAFAIEALSRIKKTYIKLLVVGRDMADQGRFEEYIRQFGVEKQIVFAGASDQTQLYYAASDAFLLPSHYDAYPLVNLEAMASGLPIITSKNTGTVDILEDSKNGLIVNDPADIGELSTKMRLLIENPRLRGSIGTAARKTMEDYSWEKMAQRTLSVYQKVK